MSAIKINRIGNKYGRLLVLKEAPRNRKKVDWICLCDCGKEVIVSGDNLNRGYTKSCGCLQREEVTNRKTIHGLAVNGKANPVYKVWIEMKARCFNPQHQNYKYYGGRGITVCERWSNLENFMMDMGPRPSNKHSIDRFPNNDGNYEPSNCRWATSEEQNKNKRNNVLIEHNGQVKTITNWAKQFKIDHTTLRRKLLKQAFKEVYKEYS